MPIQEDTLATKTSYFFSFGAVNRKMVFVRPPSSQYSTEIDKAFDLYRLYFDTL